jgi:hypothetical protein
VPLTHWIGLNQVSLGLTIVIEVFMVTCCDSLIDDV